MLRVLCPAPFGATAYSPFDSSARFYAPDDPPPGGGADLADGNIRATEDRAGTNPATTNTQRAETSSAPTSTERSEASSAPPGSSGALSLELARKQAKGLLKALRAGDSAAAQRVISQHPEFAGGSVEAVIAAAAKAVGEEEEADESVRAPAEDAGKSARAPGFRLADAQLVIAREQGQPSWPKLKAYIEAQAPLAERVAAFIDAATEGEIPRAWGILNATRQVITAGIHTLVTLGQADAVKQILAADPAAATRPCGPLNWPPLLYLCFGQLHKPLPQSTDGVVEIAAALPDPAREAGYIECARLLLEHGADPNSAYDSRPPWEGSKLSALYGVTGHGNFPAIARLLLERGADPNDGESIYHAAQRNMRECCELLLAHGCDLNFNGGESRWPTPLYFIMGYRDHERGAAIATEGARWLLEHGADPNRPSYDVRQTVLHLSCENNRKGEVIEMLLDHGADPTIARADGRTAWRVALRAGAEEALAVLAARGYAEADSDPLDLLCAACGRGDMKAAAQLVESNPGLSERLGPAEFKLLTNAAGQGRTAAVRAMLASGFSPNYQLAGEAWSEGTPLHNAAFHGWVETVRVLIEAGADLSSRDATYNSPPIGWCTYATLNFRNPAGDYPGVLRALLDAGAEWDASLDPGAEDLQAVLREYGKLS